LNERDIINLFSRSTGAKCRQLVQGIGDDCAVIRASGDRLWLVTMDTLMESIHFDSAWHPPDSLGRKSVAVNVSDIAAMGGRPAFAFLSLGLPQSFTPEWLDLFSRGLTEACRQYGCCLAGGDTVRSAGGIVITLTVIGEVASKQILYRRNARPGDDVWVSGTLGNAAAGLELCRRGKAGEKDAFPLVESHLSPAPRVDLASRLAASGMLHAMMDLSDGLATDLAHLCAQSNAGAVIYADLLPVSGLLQETARAMGIDGRRWALTGGEDYELLFTAPARNRKKIIGLAEEGTLSRIGCIDEKSGVRLAEGKPGKESQPLKDISYLGYDHFQSDA